MTAKESRLVPDAFLNSQISDWFVFLWSLLKCLPQPVLRDGSSLRESFFWGVVGQKIYNIARSWSWLHTLNEDPSLWQLKCYFLPCQSWGHLPKQDCFAHHSFSLLNPEILASVQQTEMLHLKSQSDGFYSFGVLPLTLTALSCLKTRAAEWVLQSWKFLARCQNVTHIHTHTHTHPSLSSSTPKYRYGHLKVTEGFIQWLEMVCILLRDWRMWYQPTCQKTDQWSILRLIQ